MKKIPNEILKRTIRELVKEQNRTRTELVNALMDLESARQEITAALREHEEDDHDKWYNEGVARALRSITMYCYGEGKDQIERGKAGKPGIEDDGTNHWEQGRRLDRVDEIVKEGQHIPLAMAKEIVELAKDGYSVNSMIYGGEILSFGPAVNGLVAIITGEVAAAIDTNHPDHRKEEEGD